MFNLVGHCVRRVISQIRSRLICRAGSARTLPTRHVNGLKVLGHLGDLDRVQCTVSVGRSLVLGMLLKEGPHFFGLLVGEVLGADGAALTHDRLSRVWARHAGEAWRAPPLLHLLNLPLKHFVFFQRIVRHCLYVISKVTPLVEEFIYARLRPPGADSP